MKFFTTAALSGATLLVSGHAMLTCQCSSCSAPAPSTSVASTAESAGLTCQCTSCSALEEPVAKQPVVGMDAMGPCSNPKFEPASQNLKGMQTLQIMSVNVSQTIKQSLDMDSMNMVTHVEQDMVHVGPMKVRMGMDVILNFDNRTLTHRAGITMGNKPPHCTTMQLPKWFPSAASLKSIIKLETMMLKCTEHRDDGVDVYGFDLDPKGLSLPVTVHEHVGLDKDGLLKFFDSVEHLHVGKHDTDIVKANLIVNDASPGGPSVEDMEVPDDWDCTEIHPPSPEHLLEQLDRALAGRARVIVHALRAGLAGEEVAV